MKLIIPFRIQRKRRIGSSIKFNINPTTIEKPNTPMVIIPAITKDISSAQNKNITPFTQYL